jgi:hypothetical protein
VATAGSPRSGCTARWRGSVKAAKSDELLRAAQDSGSRTNNADILLTSKRVSWVAYCRRGGGGGGKQRRRRRARVRASGGARKQEAVARVARVRATKGQRAAINSPGGPPLRAGHAQGRAQLGLGGGGRGVWVGDGEAEGMTGGALGSATACAVGLSSAEWARWATTRCTRASRAVNWAVRICAAGASGGLLRWVGLRWAAAARR